MSGQQAKAATTPEHGPPTTRRVIFTETSWWAADVEIAVANRLLGDWVDIIDVAEELTRLHRIDPHQYPVEADLTVEAAEDSVLYVDHGVIDGTKPETYYWSARKAVMAARHELISGRHREGDCREMDAVCAKLTAIEEELRVLALAVDSGRAEVAAAAPENGSSGGDQ